MHRSLRSLIVVVLLFAGSSSAFAQTRNTWSVQGSALYAELHGKVNGGIGSGAGIELQVRRKLNPLLSLGCGVQGTNHSLTELSGSEKLRGIFCEPRRLVDLGSETIFPYASARLSLLRRSIKADEFDSSADGGALALGAGVVMPIANTAGRFPTLFELGMSAGFTTFGSFLRDDGTKTGSGNGWNLMLRFGFAVGLPFGDEKR